MKLASVGPSLSALERRPQRRSAGAARRVPRSARRAPAAGGASEQWARCEVAVLVAAVAVLLFIVYIVPSACDAQQTSGQSPPTTTTTTSTTSLTSTNNDNGADKRQDAAEQWPRPIASASYLSLDGLSLVVVFDKAVNLSTFIESVERRQAAAAGVSPTAADNSVFDAASEASAAAAAAAAANQRTGALAATSRGHSSSRHLQVAASSLAATTTTSRTTASVQQHAHKRRSTCNEPANYHHYQQLDQQQDVARPVQGVQLCAQLLAKKTLKVLHKYKLHDCVWASATQFLVQLARPIASSAPVRLIFQKGTISELGGGGGAVANERELTVELNKLPLEGLGVSLAPKLALVGPNQVPPCGQFSLSALLSSPFGTHLNESVQLQWSVEKLGLLAATAAGSSPAGGSAGPRPALPFGFAAAGLSSSPAAGAANSSQVGGAGGGGGGLPIAMASTDTSQLEAAIELRWRTLRELVASNKGNNLVLEAALLQFVPQLYEFKVTATFTTTMTSITLNASHQIGRLDFDAPIGTLYSSNLLNAEQQHNTNNDLILLADIQVPECAQNVKQVGAYWQVSDPRVRFEQTYAPFYVARANTLPEQSLVEFRLNLFYGIRVKKFATAGVFVATGDSVLDAQISNGLLMESVRQTSDFGATPDQAGNSNNNNNNNQLELYGGSAAELAERQRSGEGADSDNKYSYQWSCFDGKTAQPCYKSVRVSPTGPLNGSSTRYDIPSLAASAQQQQQQSGMLLVDKQRLRQPVLRVPMSWLDADAQLWFGLQRFDRQNPSQQSKTEYALVSVQRGTIPLVVSVGPVLIGRNRYRATVRNPLTGALILVANAPVVVVGRLGPSQLVGSFSWRVPNYVHPLHWTTHNVTDPLSGRTELVTELHLTASTLIGHAHFQVQLSACPRNGLSSSAASIALDIVAGVGQCRVRATSGSVAALAAVTVDQCNIPLNLSPITYQLYMVDTTSSDGFIESSRASSGAGATATDEPSADEADEAFLEAQAQPITLSQLSPVFALAGANAAALTALLDIQTLNGRVSGNNSAQAPIATRVRFGARVCDRLQSCRMFYSAPVAPDQVLAGAMAGAVSGELVAATPTPTTSATTSVLARSDAHARAIHSLRAMLASARRANLAGNSIAAIAGLSAVIDLAAKLGATSPKQTDLEARELVQLAMRDSIQFGVQSLQRQFHYTEPGQTNLVLHSLARIMAQPQSGIELKYRAIKLTGQLARRAVAEQRAATSNRPTTSSGGSGSGQRLLPTNSLADFKAIQASFEALFGTFGQHSIGANGGGGGSLADTFATPATSNPQGAPAAASLAAAAAAASAAPEPSSAAFASAAKATKRRREDAILAYLRAVRQAHRALISAAAVQLPLGGTHQFEYQSVEPLAPPATSNGSGGAGGADHQRAGVVTTSSSVATDIVSSLVRQTEMLSDTIDVDLHEFGTVSVRFNPRLAQKLARVIATGRLRCRNTTGAASLPARPNPPLADQTLVGSADYRCSSFVLAVSSFAGKAPFRALDSGNMLRIPALDIQWLSPVDGSNLIELMRATADRIARSDSGTSNSGDDNNDYPDTDLTEADFQATATFVVPDDAGDSPAQDSPQAASAASAATADTRYKCYQFDEDSNEWVSSASLLKRAVGDLSGGPLGEPDDDQVVVVGERRVRCNFAGFGTLAAFSNAPPPPEHAARVSIVLGATGVLALVALVSLLGCLASSSRARRASSDASNSSNASSPNSNSPIGDERHLSAPLEGSHHRASASIPPVQRAAMLARGSDPYAKGYG